MITRSKIRLVYAVLLILASVQAAAWAGGEPLYMWQVKSETATVTMVGSIHVGKPEFFPLAEPFEKAFAAAGALAVEVDLTNNDNVAKVATLMMQRGMLPGDTVLQDRLDPELWKRLEEFAEDRGMPLAMYAKFKPGIVAMIMAMEEYTRIGLDPELGIDKHFLDAARKRGLEIRELETIEDQMELFFAIDDELDDILISETLDQMDDFLQVTEEMITYWQAGDADSMNDLMQENLGDDEAMEEFYRSLLDDRNIGMAATIEAWLAEDTDVFVVVGAGHFAGEKGIVSLLEDGGREVVQARR